MTQLCADPKCGHPVEAHNSVIVPFGCTAVDATSIDCVNGWQGPTAEPDPPADPDKDSDFEDLARILNRINEKHPEAMRDAFTHTFQPKEDDVSPPYTFTRAEIGEELPARKLYDENEARAIEHIATARGMLLGELLNEVENEFNRRVVDLLTSALMELVPHE